VNIDTGQLQELRERVRAATGPSRHLERTIFAAVTSGIYTDEDNRPLVREFGPTTLAPIPFTSSIDAALALVERVLPGWAWNLCNRDPLLLTEKDCKAYSACLADKETRGGPEPWTIDRDVYEGEGVTAALAILDALLSALIAQSSSVRKDAVPSKSSNQQNL
jgi:hypothetical protein